MPDQPAESRLRALFVGKKEISPDLAAQIEEVLLTSDVGVATTQVILGRLREGLDKGFGEVGLRKIVLIVRTDNAAAIRLYRQAGFADEGVLRGEVLFEGRPVDVLRMAKLRDGA
jgi:hypothetical protein